MNINQLPENHHVISSMANPFDPNEELFFVTHPRVNTYLDLDVWFCDMGTGDMRVVEPYGKVSDVRLLDYMEKHVSDNSVRFLYPAVILPISMKARGFKNDISLELFPESPDDLRLNPFSVNSDDRTYMTGDSVRERANASKALHHPSPEEISDGANKEYAARRAALKELLESGGEIQTIPKTAYHTKEFSDALATALVSDPHFSIPASYKHHPAFQKPSPKKPKPNRNLETIMGLLARTKK